MVSGREDCNRRFSCTAFVESFYYFSNVVHKICTSPSTPFQQLLIHLPVKTDIVHTYSRNSTNKGKSYFNIFNSGFAEHEPVCGLVEQYPLKAHKINLSSIENNCSQKIRSTRYVILQCQVTGLAK